MHPRMNKKLLYVLAVALLATVAVISFALPATAEQRTFRVRLSDGSVITVTVDSACGALPSLPGHVISEVGGCGTVPTPTVPAVPPATQYLDPQNGNGGNTPTSPSTSPSGGNGSSGGKAPNRRGPKPKPRRAA